jgi:hypothetical protein
MKNKKKPRQAAEKCLTANWKKLVGSYLRSKNFKNNISAR